MKRFIQLKTCTWKKDKQIIYYPVTELISTHEQLPDQIVVVSPTGIKIEFAYVGTLSTGTLSNGRSRAIPASVYKSHSYLYNGVLHITYNR